MTSDMHQPKAQPPNTQPPNTLPPDACVPGIVVDVAVDDVSRSAPAYSRLLGRATPVTDLTLGGVRIRLRSNGAKDHRMLFGTDDPCARVRLLRRRGLDVHRHREGPDEWHVDSLPFGVLASTSEPTTGDVAPSIAAADISGIDHLVFRCDDRDRAVALFGATLGLDFRLDRSVVPGLRQLFFRHGELIVEVVVTDDGTESTDTIDDSSDDPVHLWGIAWRSTDIGVTHQRMSDIGMAVSEIREGRKPGTRVVSVTDPALETRTIVIDHER